MRPDPRETQSVDVASGKGALQVLVSAAAGARIHALPAKSRFELGRSADCDVDVADASVSRRHAVIDLTSTPTVEDLGSRNGTFVGGRRIAKGERAPFELGTVVTLGSAYVVLHRASKAPLEQGVLVEDEGMLALYSMVNVIAPTSLNVLIFGETGTGKEVLAAAVHARSTRAKKGYMPINCAALSETLLESELFGHEKGAFTGATSAKVGLFEAVDGGTVFLDEVGELPLATQAKLLRVLENGEVTPVGSVRPRRVDVRIVSATNRDLASRITAGGFRADLFYRLDGMTLSIPPLRDRPLDILPLSKYFAERAANRLGVVTPVIADETSAALLAHAWPGNVRELRNVIERAVTFCRGTATIETKHLTLTKTLAPAVEPAIELRAAQTEPPPSFVAKSEETPEKQRILNALQASSGNQKEAAKLLGVSRQTLITKIERYGIARPRKRT